jgi:hypothetical protein
MAPGQVHASDSAFCTSPQLVPHGADLQAQTAAAAAAARLPSKTLCLKAIAAKRHSQVYVAAANRVCLLTVLPHSWQRTYNAD